jgi:hypothetical protein
LIERGAEEKLDRVTAEEREARREVREQLESAHGRLRAHYKTRPALAERFFMRDPGSSRRAAKACEKAGEKESKPAATPSVTPSTTPTTPTTTTTATPNTTPIKAPEAAKPMSA